jgi:diguanylate cyclase (GGDEF)-like protein
MESLQPFRHILVIEDRKARRIVALEQPTYSMGREPSNDIVIYDRIVSRHHATLLRIKKSPRHDSDYFYRIIDGDLEGHKSTNGIVVNGTGCDSHNLKHGDVIVLGNEAKVSYYILSNASEIALFNPIESSTHTLSEVTASWSDRAKPTEINSAKLQQFNRDDLMRLASFPELSPNPIVEIDRDGNLTYLNPAASIKFEKLHHQGLTHPILTGLLERAHNIEGNLLLREVKVGEDIYEQYVHYLADNNLIRSYLFDITERKKAQDTLQYQAFHDPLTELPNRAFFNQQLTLSLANAKRHHSLMAVMFLDLDGFKSINDTLGHDIGDLLLQSFARRLAGCLRGGDTLARWGGDEFTLLLPQIRSAEDTIKLAQRILNELKLPFHLGERELYVKSSIGIALYPQDGEDGETLVKHADAALYQAKEQGRDRYRFYSATMSSKASLIVKLESLLLEAIKKDELSLYYQPQVNLVTGAPTGIEALLRWFHPELGQVSPLKLISLAEETDSIVPLSEWVLRQACQQNRLWQEMGLPALPVTVNFSPRQFHHPHFINMTIATLEETGLEPHWLEIEITEASIASNSNAFFQILQQLNQVGIRVALDDFGTDIVSLKTLQRSVIQTLKIDRAIVHSLQENPQNTAAIEVILAVGRSFHLRVVAEGVETLQQLEILQRLQCEECQGYWFSHPLKPEETKQFLLESRVKV